MSAARARGCSPTRWPHTCRTSPTSWPVSGAFKRHSRRRQPRKAARDPQQATRTAPRVEPAESRATVGGAAADSSPQQGWSVADALPCRHREEASRQRGQYTTLSGSRATNQPPTFVGCSSRLPILVLVQASARTLVFCRILTVHPAPGVDRVDPELPGSDHLQGHTPGDRRTLQAVRPFNQLEGTSLAPLLGRSASQADRSAKAGKW